MQYCPACGGENTDTARFCSKCAAPLVPGAALPPPPRQQTLALQTLLRNRYLIRKLLGQGGMGAVYLAEDQQVFNRLCVVKEMLPYYTTPAERQQAEQNFQREARLLSTLRNPGIPQVYDYFIEGSRYYLVMEWVEGENLEERLARQGGRLPESEVRDHALQLANILVYISKQNPPVIHRDIKPANVILGEEGRVKLVDFGIAKATAGTGLTAGISIPLGTPGYAPPEQYSGQVEPRTDVYALGALLHHLLSGRDPRMETPFHFPPVRTLAPGVSPEMEEIVTQMLQTDVALRPTPVELRTKLESLVQGPGPSTQPQPFTFRSGEVAYSISELAAVSDRRWDEAVEHLYVGDFEPWLEQWSRRDLAVRTASIRRRGGDRSAGLEEFIRAVDHTMPMPALALSQSTLDLGTVERGERRTAGVDLMNAGRGYLHGEVVAAVPWARVSPRTFGLMAGEQATLEVTVDTSELDEGPVSQAILEVKSNGGLGAVICQADVTWQPQLGLDPEGRLDLGAVLEGEEQPVTGVFVVRNTGGGTLEGRIASDAAWLRLDTDSFRLAHGESLTVTAVAEPCGLSIEKAQLGHIHITLPMETVDFPAYLGVQKAWYTGWPRVRAWLAYGFLILLGYLGAAVPLSVGLAMLLGWPRPEDAVAGVLLAALVLSPAAFYFSPRWIPRLDEMEEYHHRGSLADELAPSCFSGKKLGWLIGALAVLGMLLGWRFADFRPEETALWLLTGGLIGAIAGGLLAAEGEPSLALPAAPPWLARFWRGQTLDTSPTYAILRSLVLLLTGGMLGLMIGTLVTRQVQPESALVGALLGLLMSSESHRPLCARLRWLLAHARLGVWMILGAYLALTALTLLRWGQPWRVVAGYSTVGFRFPGWQPLLWWMLLTAAVPLGAVGGLWAADGAGQPWARAPRTFLGLVGVLAVILLPVYLIAAAILTKAVGSSPTGNWIAILAVLAASAVAAWGVRARRASIEKPLAQARGLLAQSWSSLKAMLSAAGQRAWKALGPTANWTRAGGWVQRLPLRGRFIGLVARLRGRWSRPTLAELSAEITIPLALGAVGTAVILQEVLAALVVGLALLLGKVLLYALVCLVAVVVIVLIVRYMRTR